MIAYSPYIIILSRFALDILHLLWLSVDKFAFRSLPLPVDAHMMHSVFCVAFTFCKNEQEQEKRVPECNLMSLGGSSHP